MYQRVLVPLDGSKLSEVVFPYVKELAGALDLKVTLLHLQKPEEGESAPLHQAYVEHKAGVVRRDIEEVWQSVGAGAGKRSLEVSGELAVGYPAEEILRYAEENEVDLILMATRGRSGIRRWVMGSVADKILRTSTVPIWLINVEAAERVAYDKWPKRTIIVPLDGSKLAETVLPHVEVLTKQHGDEPMEIVLLCVSEPAVTLTYYSPSARLETPGGAVHVMPQDYERELLARQKLLAGQYLAGVAERLKQVYPHVRSEVLEGDPAKEIINYAERSPFSVIVMSTHARGGLSRWAYGSVAAKLLQKVPSPILLVRPQSSAS